MIRESDNTSPAPTPTSVLSAKPASAPSAVVIIEAASVGVSLTTAARTADGGGTRNFGTANTRTETSHKTTIAKNVTSGGTSRLWARVFSGSMFLEGLVQNGGLAREGHFGPDLVRSPVGQAY